jgi:Fur family transcriptional regulator, stress-responsive regulator
METTDEQRLRRAGLRVTRPRLAVLSVLAEARAAGEHLPVSDIVRYTRGRLGDVSTQTVYDCLEAMATAGLVRRVETAGSPARYEARVGDNHHHLVCRGCGHTVDVDCVAGAAPCLQPSESHGFAIDEAEVVFWGLCPSCSTSGGPDDVGRSLVGSTT